MTAVTSLTDCVHTADIKAEKLVSHECSVFETLVHCICHNDRWCCTSSSQYIAAVFSLTSWVYYFRM